MRDSRGNDPTGAASPIAASGCVPADVSRDESAVDGAADARVAAAATHGEAAGSTEFGLVRGQGRRDSPVQHVEGVAGVGEPASGAARGYII